MPTWDFIQGQGKLTPKQKQKKNEVARRAHPFNIWLNKFAPKNTASFATSSKPATTPTKWFNRALEIPFPG